MKVSPEILMSWEVFFSKFHVESTILGVGGR